MSYLGIGQLLVPGFGGGGGAAAVEYLLRDEFTTPEAAPLTSPRTCEPGPGTLTLVDTVDAYDISAGEFIGSAKSVGGGNPRLVGDGIARAIGVDFACAVRPITTPTTSSIQHQVGWSSISNPASYFDSDAFEIYGSSTFARLQSAGAVRLLDLVLALDTDYIAHIILRSAGCFFIIDGNLYYVSDKNATGTMYPEWHAIVANRVAFAFDSWRVFQLGSPWDTDNGVATNVVATPSNGETTTSEANASLEFTWTPGAGETLTLMFRRTDDDNTMKIECDQAAGTIKLFKRESGGDTEYSAGNTQTWTVGTPYRIYVIFNGSSIRSYVEDVDKHSATVAYNTSETGIKSTGFATGANLITWPFALSGGALDELNEFFPD